jgi:hypothetical protein
MGLINAFKGLVEIPMLFLYGRMFTDGKHAKALRIAAIFFEIKLLAFIISGNVWHLSAGFIFQAPSYALFMAAIVPYIKKDPKGYYNVEKFKIAFDTYLKISDLRAQSISKQLEGKLATRSDEQNKEDQIDASKIVIRDMGSSEDLFNK